MKLIINLLIGLISRIDFMQYVKPLKRRSLYPPFIINHSLKELN